MNFLFNEFFLDQLSLFPKKSEKIINLLTHFMGKMTLNGFLHPPNF